MGAWVWEELLSLGSKGHSRVGERNSKGACGEQPPAGCEAGDSHPCLLSGPETVGAAGEAVGGITSLVAPERRARSLAECLGTTTEGEQ